ncbi:MAG: hypothetical protein KBT03_07130 [Bacteroidales bacterium]|nr:hypothetical protein [Candidatus Scybalousia scybalohippi]
MEEVQSLNSITLQANQNGYVQFGRIIKVEVRNFKTKQKITFQSPLRIEFDFFKTIDEIAQASVGQVRIFNLSEDTHKFVTEAGSELQLSFGYNKPENVKPLFYGAITSVSRQQDSDDVVSIFNVCANFMEYQFSRVFSNYQETTFLEELSNVVTAVTGKDTMNFRLRNFPIDTQDSVAEYLQTAKVIAIQDPMNGKSALTVFSEKYGVIGRNVTNEDGSKSFDCEFKDEVVNHYIEKASQAYEKIEEVTEESSVQIIKTKEVNESNFNNLYETLDNETSYIFSRDSGLLGSPQEEVQIVSVPESWNIGTNEQITRRGAETIAKKEQREAEKLSKWKKRKAEGKKVKDFKPRKEGKKQISRTFVRVKALINPSVKPQTHVTIDSQISDYDGVYRVRNITLKGTNGAGECYMELYCEDSSGVRDSHLTEEQKKQVQDSGGGLNLTGQLGNSLEEGVTVEGDTD